MRTAYFGHHARVEKNLPRREAGQVIGHLQVRDISIRRAQEAILMQEQVQAVQSYRFIPIHLTMQTGLRSQDIVEMRRHFIFRGRLDGHEVVAIGDRAFENRTDLRTVMIPDSVEK